MDNLDFESKIHDDRQKFTALFYIANSFSGFQFSWEPFTRISSLGLIKRAQDRKLKETDAHPQILHPFIALLFVFPSKGVVYFAHHGTILKVFITNSFEV